MRLLFSVFICLFYFTVSSQQTYVPDDNFEAYLEANGMGNGIANDDSVTTSNINTITNLNVSYRFILDLTGIEDFTALTYLRCDDNQLTSLDVRNGNNINFSFFFNLVGNPNLNCISVDDTAYSNANWSTFIDNHTSFSNDCALFSSLTFLLKS